MPESAGVARVRGARRRVSASLPDFPWDTIAAAKARAAEHPGGIVDLSVGTPVDPVSEPIRRALYEASAVPGYPATAGTLALREAAAAAMERRFGVTGLTERHILPVIGTKEFIAGLPGLLGLGPGDAVVFPEVAYPTYEVGALLAGAEPVRADSTLALGPRTPGLFYVNSPSNPTGRVLGAAHLRKVADWARERNVVVASDECYLGLVWESEDACSLLSPEVCGGDLTGLLAIQSLSKTSNLAGYRAGFVAGDPELIAELLAVRKHAGLMMPYAVGQAMIAALGSDEHEREQYERYRARRDVLRPAVEAAGFRIDDSTAGLYLWATRGEPCRVTVAALAELGILAAPGDFYGPAGAEHVRIALTATDERIAAAAERLRGR